MSADLTILISNDSGIIVPSAAVSSLQGRYYLDVFENGEVVTKRVSAGADDGFNIVITEGLQEGEKGVQPLMRRFLFQSPPISAISPGTGPISSCLAGGACNPIIDETKTIGQGFAALYWYLE
ncbi:hypothetical protein [Marispirochaeta sp.]|uniref:hypothetical protein n=1 Tax=Marispirochaeta sp. TaxID=2038653 RepID=UPI0029C684B9|nr:hypothetical protein [Marispirochaeta sp.]